MSVVAVTSRQQVNVS